MIVKCKQCSKEFNVEEYKVKNGKGKYCSRYCYYQAKTLYSGKDITLEELKKVLEYNPETGVFIRKIKLGGRKVGEVAGHIRPNGYLTLNVNGKTYYGHRLAWLYVYGKSPDKLIDHQDGDPSNNKIDNLREVCHRQNLCNQKLNKNNKSGCNGVYLFKKRNKWIAQIKLNSKSTYLGIFNKKIDAIKCRKEAEKKYGYHENHGRR